MNGFWIFAAVLLCGLEFGDDIKCALGNDVSCAIAESDRAETRQQYDEVTKN